MLVELLKVVALLRALATGQVGVATTFWSIDDPYNPDSGMACYRGKKLVDSARLVAHPTLPCKSRVFLYNLRTRKSTVAIVADRGPKRALVDLSRGAAKAIGSNGMEQVLMFSLP